MLRDMLAAIVGIAIAITIVFLSDQLSSMMYPVPEELDSGNLQELGEHIATLPLAAYLMVIAGRVIATFIGAVVANRIGKAQSWVYPTTVGGFVFAATTAVVIAIPHPHWFSAILLTSILISAWLAWQIARKV
ncbi:MAG: hypothetical protein WBA70_07515 [Thermodesulfobacteriota bacterium]